MQNINNRNFILKASSLDDLDRVSLQGNVRVIPKSIILEMKINIGEIISVEDRKIYRYESGRYWPEEARMLTPTPTDRPFLSSDTNY